MMMEYRREIYEEATKRKDKREEIIQGNTEER